MWRVQNSISRPLQHSVYTINSYIVVIFNSLTRSFLLWAMKNFTFATFYFLSPFNDMTGRTILRVTRHSFLFHSNLSRNIKDNNSLQFIHSSHRNICLKLQIKLSTTINFKAEERHPERRWMSFVVFHPLLAFASCATYKNVSTCEIVRKDYQGEDIEVSEEGYVNACEAKGK